MLGRAQCLFQACALPQNVAYLLRQAFAVRSARGNTTETVLARVLVAAQQSGYASAVQEMERLGIPATPLKPWNVWT